MIVNQFVTGVVSIYLLSLSGVFARRADIKFGRMKRSHPKQSKDTADPSHFAAINSMTYSQDDQEYFNYDEETINKNAMGFDTANKRTEEQNLYDDYASMDTDYVENDDDRLRKYYGLESRRAAYDDYESMDVRQLMRSESRNGKFMRKLIPDFANDQPWSDSADDKIYENDYSGVEDDMYVD